MVTSPSSRSCPNCGHVVHAWRIWLITHWSCIRCSHCGVRLNRRVSSLHSCIMLLISMPLIVPAVLVETPFGQIHLPIIARVLSFIGACLVGSAYDAQTVRLIENK